MKLFASNVPNVETSSARIVTLTCTRAYTIVPGVSLLVSSCLAGRDPTIDATRKLQFYSNYKYSSLPAEMAAELAAELAACELLLFDDEPILYSTWYYNIRNLPL